MPCLLIIVATLTPRLVIALLWLFSSWFNGVFETRLWPVLGFFFLPTTLLWYSVVQQWFGGEWDVIPLAGVVLALMIDLSPARRPLQRKRREP